MNIIDIQQDKDVVEKDLTSLAAIMAHKHRGPRPPDAVSVYTVKWHLLSDSFSVFGTRLSNSPAPIRLERTKNFANKEKALKLKTELESAFITLGYQMEGRVIIEEDWIE